MKNENYIKFYKGEKKNPFTDHADDKPELWDIERAFVIADRNSVITMNEAMALYKGAKLAWFMKDDGIPVEYKAYLYMRIGKYRDGDYADKFKAYYKKYYAN